MSVTTHGQSFQGWPCGVLDNVDTCFSPALYSRSHPGKIYISNPVLGNIAHFILTSFLTESKSILLDPERKLNTTLLSIVLSPFPHCLSDISGSCRKCQAFLLNIKSRLPVSLADCEGCLKVGSHDIRGRLRMTDVNNAESVAKIGCTQIKRLNPIAVF